MTAERLTILINKYLSNTATPEEEQELTAWYQAANEQEVHWPVADEAEAAALKARLLNNIQAAIHPAAQIRSIPFYRQKRWQVAAAIFVLISTGVWLWLGNAARTNPVISDTTAVQEQIVPGGDKAVLALSDGSFIVLDSADNGVLRQQGNTKIVKINSGRLAFAPSAGVEQGEPLYNKISTPKGGQYEVILPDGSHVWLNAASSLRFPAAFTTKERKVELTGEAYFEVAKDATKPFRVHFSTGAGEGREGIVEVLGTHFNINAYDDEASTKTTLLEGSVRVMPLHSAQPAIHNSKLLSAGQQAVISTESTNSPQIQVQTVDTEEVIAWKNGKFHFNQADIKTVMRQIARWYNVEVMYEGPVSKEKFEGEIPRNSSLSDVFKILELSAVHFKTEGRKVIVMP